MGAGRGWVRGAEGMGASAGGSAWACPFKGSCLLSSFGTQPLSCLRLQRQRIKGLFYLNETLSPTSSVLASLLDSPSLPGVLRRAEGGCWVPRQGVLVGDGWWEMGAAWGEVPGQEQGRGSASGLAVGWGMALRPSRRAVSLPRCHRAAHRDTLLPVPCQEHWVPSVILAGDVAVLGTSTASWRIVAVGRSEPSSVPALSGTHLGPGYIAVGEV